MRLWSALKWWWLGEGLSAPDVLVAREERDRWNAEALRLRDEVKSCGVMIDAKESELIIRRRDCLMLTEIIKREQVRVQAETAMASRMGDRVRE
jgi:hypothetical protein